MRLLDVSAYINTPAIVVLLQSAMLFGGYVCRSFIFNMCTDVAVFAYTFGQQLFWLDSRLAVKVITTNHHLLLITTRLRLHCFLMQCCCCYMFQVRGVPLYQLHSNRVSAEQAQSIFEQSAILASRLAQHGLVHCDLNEFNLMVDLSGVQSKIASVDDNENDDALESGGNPEKRNWEDDATEHYVRHSGMPVKHKGALSSHGPLQKHSIDGTGEVVTEKVCSLRITIC